MHISWLGQTCIKIQTKNLDREALVLLDTYKPKRGNFPRSFTPDIALFSQDKKKAATLSQDPFVIDTLGEFEMKNIVFYSLPHCQSSRIFKIVTENMTVVHLGGLEKSLDNGQIEEIITPDILFIPVGGPPNYLEIKKAAELALALEPRIIIPIGYKCDTEPEAKSVSQFISETGLKPENENKKIIIKKKDLPQEEMRLIVLDKE